VILLLPHVVDLLGERLGVNFVETARAQQLGLAQRPTVKVVRL
jgi:hypothetical protein